MVGVALPLIPSITDLSLCLFQEDLYPVRLFKYHFRLIEQSEHELIW